MRISLPHERLSAIHALGGGVTTRVYYWDGKEQSLKPPIMLWGRDGPSNDEVEPSEDSSVVVHRVAWSGSALRGVGNGLVVIGRLLWIVIVLASIGVVCVSRVR